RGGGGSGAGMSGDRTGERHTELTFTGPATFFKAPYVPGLQADDGEANAAELPAEFVYDAAFLGVPHDFAVGFRPGARFAPAAVRAASGRYALPPEGLYDF